MQSIRTMSLALVALVALTLAVSPALAETAAPATTPAAKHEAPPAVKVTLEDLEKRPKTQLKIAKTDIVLHVADLHCSHCAKNLSSKLFTVKGVVKIRTDIKADVAIITPQRQKKINPMDIWKAADKSNFPALKLESPDGTYVRDAKTKEVVRLADQKPAPVKS